MCGDTHTAERLRSSLLNFYDAREISNVGLKLQKLVPYISKSAKKLHADDRDYVIIVTIIMIKRIKHYQKKPNS